MDLIDLFLEALGKAAAWIDRRTFKLTLAVPDPDRPGMSRTGRLFILSIIAIVVVVAILALGGLGT